MRKKDSISLTDDPLWYKDAIIYELHVKSFCDSNDDGIGDFKGLTSKLDYLESLGVTAIWLLPFYPSPLKDDGYDIADYMDVNPDYGTLKDFKEFLKEAHKRGLRVITELVLNHTSDQHEWFKKSRSAKKGSSWRNYYVWSDTPQKYEDARIIFQDFEHSNWTWDHVAKQYYWHRFYSHQPDLNFEHPVVHRALLRVIDFWLAMGVDGLRLDAVPYLYESEGTNCENLPETHEFLRKLRDHVNGKHKDKMLLAEANQWPEDAVAYFGDGDECHMAFHFPLMPRMFMAMNMETSAPIIDILEQTPDIPDSCQWAIFLRNHDELTLEMVTDEERDYMYNSYAKDSKARINLGIRRRLAPLLLNNRRKIELLNMMLLTLPGTPVIYYGDEIGMGDNYYLGDRDGVRTPMQWNSDRNSGFSKTNPQKLFLPVIIDPEYHYESVNVESQNGNISSLLWWMKKVINLRKKYQAFGRGSIEFLPTSNDKVLFFVRKYQDEIILCVYSFSRYPLAVQIDLSDFEGYVPLDIFSRNKFPIITQQNYTLTLTPFGYYAFELIEEKATSDAEDVKGLPSVKKLVDLFENSHALKLEKLLLEYIKKCSWFKGKVNKIRKLGIKDSLAIDVNDEKVYLSFLKLSYQEGDYDLFMLPISFTSDNNADALLSVNKHSLIAATTVNGNKGYIYDATFNSGYHKALLSFIKTRGSVRFTGGAIHFKSGKKLKDILKDSSENLTSTVYDANQTHASVMFENTFFLKLFRKVQSGINSELEITSELSRSNRCHDVLPEFLGEFTYKSKEGESITLGLLYQYVENSGSMWVNTLDYLSRLYEGFLVERPEIDPLEGDHLEVGDKEIMEKYSDFFSYTYLLNIHALGQKTSRMHKLLSGINDDDFIPEKYTKLYQRALYSALISEHKQSSKDILSICKKENEGYQDDLENILSSSSKIKNLYSKIIGDKIDCSKIRVHGDYHLAQILIHHRDYRIIDFEGNNLLPLSQRRLKMSPLKDVASMIYSFYYSANFSLYISRSYDDASKDVIADNVSVWIKSVSSVFYEVYYREMLSSGLLPEDKKIWTTLLKIFLIERGFNQISKEINRNSNRLIVPFKCLNQILEDYL